MPTTLSPNEPAIGVRYVSAGPPREPAVSASPLAAGAPNQGNQGSQNTAHLIGQSGTAMGQPGMPRHLKRGSSIVGTV